MALTDYAAENDRFELDRGCLAVGGLDFPCVLCEHRGNSDRDEPCRTCGHNAYAVMDRPVNHYPENGKLYRREWNGETWDDPVEVTITDVCLAADDAAAERNAEHQGGLRDERNT